MNQWEVGESFCTCNDIGCNQCGEVMIEADGVLGSNVVGGPLQGLELVDVVALAMSEVAVDIPA